VNLIEAAPVEPPPNLRGDKIVPGCPEHWMFLLARHGRGVNVATADGGAHWVPLEETYRLTWTANWQKYRLRLPRD
jgi:prepilin-type processing-associated H-X9-DG protein